MNFGSLLKLLQLAQTLLPVFLKAWQDFQSSLKEPRAQPAVGDPVRSADPLRTATEPCDPAVEAKINELLAACGLPPLKP